jgi:hypothetical protein
MKSNLQEFEYLTDPEENIRYTWTAFTTHLDKPRALWFAYNAKKFLDNQEIPFDKEDETIIEKVYRKGLGYHVVAMAYIWNEWYEEAFELEEFFITRLYWHAFREGIEQYIEMLIVMKQERHLEEIFTDTEFRYCFLNHYEAYISLLVNPDLTITKMNEFVPLVNKINGLNRTYGDEKGLF